MLLKLLDWYKLSTHEIVGTYFCLAILSLWVCNRKNTIATEGKYIYTNLITLICNQKEKK